MKKLMIVSVLIVFLIVSVLVVQSARAKQPAANKPVEIKVIMKEYKVLLSTDHLPANTPITFTITNEGTVTHEAVLEKAGVVDEPLEINGEGSEVEDIAPGETKSAIWTISEAGQYQLACHVPGHYEGGMVEMFAVTPPGIGGVLAQPAFWIVFSAVLILGAVWLVVWMIRRPARNQAA
jgi:uncharacterized cupredoxin-like copper-binding protein